jgi:hypothetical protein
MHKLSEYLQHAAERRKMAAQMKDPQHKKQLEDMVEACPCLRRSVKSNSKDMAMSQTDEGHAESESMHIGANDNAQVEADPQFRMFDVSDDELERAANDHQQAATWSIMPHWWICPV